MNTIKAKRRKLLRKRASEFLKKRGVDIPGLKKYALDELPPKLGNRAKRTKHGKKRQQELDALAEGYARFIVFKSKIEFPGLVAACHSYQDMLDGGKTKQHSGLVRCILGFRPSGAKQEERQVVSKYYSAFERLLKAGDSPTTVATGKSSLGATLSEILDPTRKSRAPVASKKNRLVLQSLGLNVPEGIFGVALFRGTSKGRAKVIRHVILGSSKADALAALAAVQKHEEPIEKVPPIKLPDVPKFEVGRIIGRPIKTISRISLLRRTPTE